MGLGYASREGEGGLIFQANESKKRVIFRLLPPLYNINGLKMCCHICHLLFDTFVRIEMWKQLKEFRTKCKQKQSLDWKMKWGITGKNKGKTELILTVAEWVNDGAYPRTIGKSYNVHFIRMSIFFSTSHSVFGEPLNTRKFFNLPCKKYFTYVHTHTLLFLKYARISKMQIIFSITFATVRSSVVGNFAYY